MEKTGLGYGIEMIAKYLAYEKILNKNDYKILDLLIVKPLSVGDITKALKIAPVNTWKHLNKLKKINFIIMPKVKKGQKKIIEISSEGKEHFQILKQLKKYNKK